MQELCGRRHSVKAPCVLITHHSLTALVSSLCLLHKSLATTGVFSISVILPFPEFHMQVFMQTKLSIQVSKCLRVWLLGLMIQLNSVLLRKWQTVFLSGCSIWHFHEEWITASTPYVFTNDWSWKFHFLLGTFLKVNGANFFFEKRYSLLHSSGCSWTHLRNPGWHQTDGYPLPQTPKCWDDSPRRPDYFILLIAFKYEFVNIKKIVRIWRWLHKIRKNQYTYNIGSSNIWTLPVSVFRYVHFFN